jgi:hypothetical protein
MDFQTGLVYVSIVVISALAIGFILMLGTREKSYEEAIAEQRKLPDDLLLSMLICIINSIIFILIYIYIYIHIHIYTYI